MSLTRWCRRKVNSPLWGNLRIIDCIEREKEIFEWDERRKVNLKRGR